MNQQIETIIIGGGQAGLATSYYLTQHGRPHLVLERASQPASAWRNERWDSFTLVTPNWSFRLPGAEYEGDAPDGFLPRREIVNRFEQYVDNFHLPIQYGAQVVAVEQNVGGSGYLVRTAETVYETQNVVIATGLFQRPRIPELSAALSLRIKQLHSSQYRNSQALPPGAVLVVGSGQSGSQIAEELYQNGRQVYLCVGKAGRAPRRYRGKDIYEWLHLSGFFSRPADMLPSPQARFAPIPHVSGRDGGHNLNLHQFARDGVTLLGRLQDAVGETIHLAPDLKESLAMGDGFEAQMLQMVDGFIARSGLDAPPPDGPPQLRDGYETAEIKRLNLETAGISTVIWATGYTFDFNMVKLPIFDEVGYPIQKSGATAYPGLFFVGLPWLSGQMSGLLLGVGENAAHIAATISETVRA